MTASTSSKPPAFPRLVGRALELAAERSDWQSLRPGVEILRVCGDPRTGASVALLRYAPGAQVPEHRHVGFEVIYVLSGAQSDERGTYPAGTLVVNREGDVHHVWSDDGCLVLILWERPIEFV